MSTQYSPFVENQNAPLPVSFQKQVIIDNSTGNSDITKTYVVKYSAWATITQDTNKAQVVNIIPSSFAGYDNDPEALLSKIQYWYLIWIKDCYYWQ